MNTRTNRKYKADKRRYTLRSPNLLLNFICEKHGCKYDADLAQLLQLHNTTIAQLRHASLSSRGTLVFIGKLFALGMLTEEELKRAGGVAVEGIQN